MAVDRNAIGLVSAETMYNISEAILEKNGGSTTYKPSEMPAAIRAISTLNADTQDANAVSGDILKSKTAYVKGQKVTGSIESKAAATYNPSASDQTISAGQYLSGAQTIKAVTASNIPTSLKETKSVTAPLTGSTTVSPTDGKVLTGVTVSAPDMSAANATAANIQKGAKAYGADGTLITGTHTEEGLDNMTADATATNADLLKDKTAYANGTKITGTIESLGATTYQPTLSLLPGTETLISSGVYLSGDQSIKKVTPTTVKNQEGWVGVTVITPLNLVFDTVPTSKVSTRFALNEAPSYESVGSEVQVPFADSVYSRPTVLVNHTSSKTPDQFPVSLTANSEYFDGYNSVTVNVNMSAADVTAADIVSGKKAYGADGTLLTGTHTEQTVADLTNDANATAGDILLNKTAYVNGQKLTGTIASLTATTINPSASDQVIQAGAYLEGAQTIKAVTASNIPSTLKEAKTVTAPLTGSTTVSPTNGKVITGVTVNAADMSAADVTAADIVSGKKAYGADGTLVTGTHTEQTVADLTNDANATAADLLLNKTAYVNGQKITGSIYSTAGETFEPSVEEHIIRAGLYLEGDQVIKAVTAENIPEELKESKTITASLTVNTDVTPTEGKVLTGVTVNRPIMSAATATAVDIKKGSAAYGADGSLIVGTYEEKAGGSDTTDATATAENILKGKTAYVATGKVTGTMEAITCYQGDEEPGSALGEVGDIFIMVDLSAGVTYTLNNASATPQISNVNLGEAFTANISATNDHHLTAFTVTMNGVDVTNDVATGSLADGYAINIDSVTGPIVITAKGVSDTAAADSVGTLDDEGTYDITLDSSLASGTYSLVYEDEDGNPLENWSEVASITK